MPAETESYGFLQPDDGAILGRYMPLVRLESLLDSSSLYLCRSDLFDDPFEGSLPRATVDARAGFWGVDDPVTLGMSLLFRSSPKWMYVNCWHMNLAESDAMWRLYGRDGSAVSIQTTYARLRDALPADILIGAVQYLDYDADSIPEDSVYRPYMHKRLSFAHEREVRVLLWKVPEAEPMDVGDAIEPQSGEIDLNTIETPPGILVRLDLAKVIQCVTVAPGATEVELHEAQRLVAAAGLDVPVLRSKMDMEPSY